MLDVKWSVTMQFANVLQDTLVIHSQDVLPSPSNLLFKNQLILVHHLLVDPTLNVL